MTVKPMTKALTALVLLVSLVIAGCSSDAKSDAKADKTTTTATPTTGKYVPASPPSTTSAGTGGDDGTTGSGSSGGGEAATAKVIAQLEAVDTSNFCSGLAGMVSAFKTAVQDNPVSTPAQVKEVNAALKVLLDKIGKQVPADLQDDWKVFAASSQTSDADKSEAQIKAQKNIATYVQANCKLSGLPAS